jgi:putative transposase
MVSAPARREQARFATMRGLSLRRACALVGVARSAVGYVSRRAARDAPIRARLRQLSREQPRWGHRFMRAMLKRDGHAMSLTRTLRLWRAEGLCLPRRRPRRRRRGAASAVPFTASRPNEVWAIDFVFDRCEAGTLKCLTVIDEHTRRCLALDVARSLRAHTAHRDHQDRRIVITAIASS